jgi:CRISPR-associated protein Csx16
MSVILVSRHAGTLDWFAKKGLPVDIKVAHFDIDIISKGDTVVGVLPIQLVAKVCELGAYYFHLEMDVPIEYRGKELSSHQLDLFGAKLIGYTVYKNTLRH